MPLYFDATFSWSGYSYQGKIGIYIVLKKLNEFQGNDLENYFNNWFIEFEWLEDFSIKQGTIYQSLHQVKTLKSKNINSYTSAIQQTIVNSTSLGYPITPYFHVSSNVVNPHNTFYNYNINGNNKQYCPLDEIDTLIKKEIKDFLNIYNEPDYNGDCENSHFFKLLAIIDNHVRIRHENIQAVGRNVPPEEIEFTTIINSLRTDSRQFTNERMIYEKKIYFMNIVDEYCQNKSDEVKTKINEVARNLFDLEDNNFICFIKSISPHIQTSNNDVLDLSDFQGLLQKDATKGCFFKSIHKINEFKVFIERKYLEKLTKKYLPTTINREEEAVEEICQDILDNPYAIENLFEMDCFITERISCESIEEDTYNTTDIRDEDLPNIDRQEYKINELKKVKMIKIEEAERILNA